jgi:hypothetical protein
MALVNLAKAADAAYYAQVDRLRDNSPLKRAPLFAQRCDAAVAECNAAGLDVISFETDRIEELQALYFTHGVTRVPHANQGWHFYWLAEDFISKSKNWDVYPGADGSGGDPDWYGRVHEIFKSHQLDAGSDWSGWKDWPHWQFGGMLANPHNAITAYQNVLDGGGDEQAAREAVWKIVGAM